MIPPSQSPSETVVHHPSVLKVPRRTRLLPPGYFIEFGGAITRNAWVDRPAAPASDIATECEAPATPEFGEEYFEWTDLLEAIEGATRGSFVIVELGAGHGRWSVRGLLGARAAGLSGHCVAVEADPTHARWLRQHFLDNDVRPDDHELVWAAIGPEAGFVPFRTGTTSAHYGQYVSKRTNATYPTVSERRRLRARAVLGRPPRSSDEARESMWVPCLSLPELLAPYPVVDLLDTDIQGAELGVLAAAMHSLNTRVRRVHVGTHSAEIEQGLRQLFTAHGWHCLHDYPGQSVTATPYGPIRFIDGVQSWSNPGMGGAEDASTGAPAPGSGEVERLAERVRVLKKKVSRLAAERDELKQRLLGRSEGSTATGD